MKPSIEAAAKMAQILDVSLDWLAGHTDLVLDKKMIQRIHQGRARSLIFGRWWHSGGK